MYLHEALKTALKYTGGYVVREAEPTKALCGIGDNLLCQGNVTALYDVEIFPFTPWNPSVADLIADDWEPVYNANDEKKETPSTDDAPTPETLTRLAESVAGVEEAMKRLGDCFTTLTGACLALAERTHEPTSLELAVRRDINWMKYGVHVNARCEERGRELKPNKEDNDAAG